VPPLELLAKARSEIGKYETIEFHAGHVAEIAVRGTEFSIGCADGRSFRARKVLLTTGLIDEVPRIDGIEGLYGRGVHHCPYCDGFEYRDQPVAAYGKGDKAGGLALMLKQWSDDVILCTNERISLSMRRRLRKHDIPVFCEPIAKLESSGADALRAIHLQSGQVLERNALFFTTGSRQSSELSASLACARDEKGGIITNPLTEESSTRGVYVAGDASRDVLLVAVAIGEGAKAAVAINRALLKDDGLG
jgi:thioredoxin reductase